MLGSKAKLEGGTRRHAVGFAGRAALSLSSTFIALGLFTIGAALPTLQTAFAHSANAGLLIQLIGSIAAFAFALASPLAGLVVARLGVRTVYLGSTILFLAVSAAPALSNSLLAIAFLRVLTGLAVAGVFTAGMAGIAQLPGRQRHAILGVSAFLGGGIAMFAYQATGLLAAENWRLSFAVVLVLLPSVFLGLFLPRHQPSDDAAIGGQAAERLPKGTGVPLRVLVIAMIIGWTMVAGSIYSPFYLAALGITDPARIGFILAVLAMGSLAGSAGYGFLQYRLGTAGATLAGLGLCTLGCAVLAWGGGEGLAMTGLGLIGSGLGAAGTAIYALAIEMVGSEAHGGAATGVVSLAIYLPQAAFPLLAQLLASAFGAPPVYLVVAGLLVLAMGLLVLRLPSPMAAPD